jgi:hypothetical protein
MLLPGQANTLAALQAMQTLILNEVLVASVSLFATLSASDQTRYGVSRAVFIGKPKDWKDAYLPACTLWVPPRDPAQQPVEMVGYAGRVLDEVEVQVTCWVDLRTDWYAGEQQILAIRDALWPTLLKHERLGGTVAGVTQATGSEGRGLAYETVAGVEYRIYQAVWRFSQQYVVAGGRSV